MKAIEFDATFGMERKRVVISQPLGAGDIYHVYVDHYYYGMVAKRQGEYQGLLNTHDLTADDVLIIGDLIEEQLRKEGAG